MPRDLKRLFLDVAPSAALPLRPPIARKSLERRMVATRTSKKPTKRRRSRIWEGWRKGKGRTRKKKKDRNQELAD